MREGRQGRRVQWAIEAAFVELVRERGYANVTVADIAERADVGRTTFYRYYEGKAEVFLAVHAQRFERMGFAATTAEAWLSAEPSPALLAFVQMVGGQARFQSMFYQLGAEIDRIQREMQQKLVRHFEQALASAFGAQAFQTPLPVVASGVAGTFFGMMQPWAFGQSDPDAEVFARHLHRLMRAQVLTALGYDLRM